MKALLTSLLVLLLSAAALGCSNAAPNPRTCGEGTTEVDNVCQSQMTCGAGTQRVGDQCQFTPSVLCGSGTVLTGDTCEREEAERSCGEDVVEFEGTCVREYPLVTCGDGTIEQSGQCVVADPLACGQGTTTVGTVCTSETCGVGTALLDDGITCEATEYLPTAGLGGLCVQVAHNYCEAFGRCECSLPEDAGTWIQLVYDDPALCEAVWRTQCSTTQVWLTVFEAMGQFEADVEGLNKFVSMYEADVDCNTPATDLVGGPDYTVSFFDLLLPGVGSGERCFSSSFYPTNVCQEEGQICRLESETEEETLYACQDPVGLYLPCASHAECLESLYCEPGTAEEEDVCQTRPELAGECNVTTLPCAGASCCLSNLCVELPAEGDTCCGDSTCGDNEVLYCRTVDITTAVVKVCSTYAAEGESCEDGIICDNGLLCHILSDGDGVSRCYAEVPFCERYPL